jgi:hypothetical protein
MFTLARDSAFDKLTPVSSPSLIRSLVCSPPPTKIHIIYIYLYTYKILCFRFLVSAVFLMQ